ncbi:serine hydrolase domain-containing protein [Jatrophihabitans sp. DSM 45814]
MKDELSQLTSWPVPNCAAAVVGPVGVLAATGDLDHSFPLASVTKPLAALATLIAMEEGAVELDAPILDHGIAAELPGITLRQLLSHASGIGPERRQRAASPGTRRIYSNAGFDVIGELLTTATEMPFGRYLDEAVFAPLAMRSSKLDGSPAKDGVSTVGDLTAVLSELLRPTGLLDDSTLKDLATVQFPGLSGVLPGYGSQSHNDWGLGFEIRDAKSPHWTSDRNSSRTYGHFGRSGTMFWVDPVAQLALVALSDRDFDEWAIAAWPELSDTVLDAFG